MKKTLTLLFSAFLSVCSIYATGEWEPITGSLQEGDVVIFKDVANGFSLGSIDLKTDYSAAAFTEFSTTNPDIQYIVGGTDGAWTFTVKSTAGTENPYCLTKGNASNTWTTQIGTTADDSWSLTEVTSGNYQLTHAENSGKVLGCDDRTIGSSLYRDKSGDAAITWQILHQATDTVVYNGEYFRIFSNNLIPNGSFNDSLKYWTAGDGSALSIDKFTYNLTGGAIDDGAYIIGNTNEGSGAAGSIKTYWNIDSTKTYLLRYYIKQNIATTAGSSQYLRISTTDDIALESNPIDSGAWNADNVWTLNSVFFDASKTNDTLLLLQFRWLAEGAYSIDEVSLVEAVQIAKVDVAPLAEAIDTAQKYTAYNYPGLADLNIAITNAQSALDTIEKKSELNAAIQNLTSALNFYKLSPATKENPVNATFVIDNPSFETGSLGKWTASAGGDVGVKENANGTYNMTPCDGSYLFNTWSNGAADNLLAQTIEVPNGTYSMTAIVASDAGNTITLYANTFELTCDADTALGKAASLEYTLENILVTNKRITIGAKSGNWYKVDNFRLTYYGEGEGNAAKDYLKELLIPFKALDLTLSPNGVDAIVTATIGTAETAAAGDDNDAIAKAIDDIADATTIYKASLTDYAELKTAIDSANYLIAKNYPGKAAFQLALDTATAVYNADTTLTIHLDPATAKLYTAMVPYLLTKVPSSDDPTDYTSYITDPSFELSSGTTLGGNWKLNNVVASGGDFRTNNAITPPNGNQFWNNWSDNFTSMEIYQEIANLPNGEYMVTCRAITQKNADSTTYLNDQHLYATTYETVSDYMVEGYDGFDDIQVWQLMRVKFYVTTGSVRIGFASTFPTGATYGQTGWFCIDDFHLYYYGPNQNAVLETLNNLITTIKSDRDDYSVPFGEDAVLDNFLTSTETFLKGSYTPEELDSVLTATNTAWSYFKKTQEKALALEALIVEASETAETADETVYPQAAIEELEAAIEIASDILGGDESLVSDCDSAYIDLQAAIKAFHYKVTATEDNPADFTFAIVNPELTKTGDVPDGWTASYENGNGYTGQTQHYLGSGLIYFDAWNGTAGLLKYNAHQDIADLPAGEYTFMMAGRATWNQAEGEDGVQIYALNKKDSTLYSTNVPTEGDGNVSTADAIPADLETALFQEDGVTWYGWNDVIVPHILLNEGDTLQIGIDVGYFGTFTGTWFSGTEPRLTYLGKTALFTSLDNVTDQVISVYVLNHRIMVEGSQKEAIVYNVAGMKVANKQLSKGIYMVRVEDKSFKVIVR